MTFSFDLSEELKITIKILSKKDRKTVEIINKKIKQIINSDKITIEYYKNLRYELKEYKRVHIAKSFVLLFRVFKKDNHILFERFKHHDNVYRKS